MDRVTDRMEERQARYWAVVPAAGVGKRMQSTKLMRPKQYLEIRGHSILEYTLMRLGQLDVLSGILLVLHPDDSWFSQLDITLHCGLDTTAGGAERAISVYHGLKALAARADDNDWVLVHDVVRPCVSLADLNRLVSTLSDDPVGGLLALPVTETMKKVAPDGAVAYTVPRDDYRLAGTPQMFRYGLLMAALSNALELRATVTDEAQAMERMGHPVKLVPGGADNIKITHPEDLVLAEFILKGQGVL